MIKKLVILSILIVNLLANEFSIASYNVENFFDLTNDGNEYIEYTPNNKHNWNKTTYQTKLHNISKVIKELSPTIIALQEIESKRVIEKLQLALPQYKYTFFSKYKSSSNGLAVLSKIEIIDNKTINVGFFNKLYRPIQEITFKYQNIKFKLFNNHWPSKRVDEKYRIKYAYKLFSEITKIPKDLDYILIGDFNSNYNESETFGKNKKLNTSLYITGINQVLNTSMHNRLIRKENILEFQKRVHYNLWLELKYKNRFSYKFMGNNQTPDSIILSPALFDNKKISYVNNSFRVFKPEYLYKNNKINRWKIKNKIHQNKGFSDHLPIIATFNISKFEKEKPKLNSITKISQLYEVDNLKKPAFIKNCVVIFKDKYGAIIKQKNSRAIYIYKKEHNLKLGFSYDLKIDEIKHYQGLKEISAFEIQKTNQKVDNISSFFIGQRDDFNKLKYQNEIVQNLAGFYKKNYFYYDNYKIRIFFKDKTLKPEKTKRFFIKRAHIGFYKTKPQLVIYTSEDFE